MNKYEFANMLCGRKYGNEITDEEINLAKESNLVVIFGASDDLCEFRGAINDEFDCYDGGTIKCDKLPKPIEALWCPKNENCSWAYDTDLPHADFRILDEDNENEIYCYGLVIDLNEVEMMIKVCPICGGEAHAFKDECNKFGIKCDECNLVFGITFTDEYGDELDGGWCAAFDTVEEAVKAWNRRSDNDKG